MNIKNNFNHTIYASYIGYITQAIVNNFTPLLFLTFSRQFALSLDKIALITTVNFGVQLIVDLLSAKAIDRIGYRASVIIAHIFSALGLCGLAVLPNTLSNGYAGILICVVLYAIGGGIIEVMISPIVEACPTERKEAAMSLLHSFYCWGHVGVVVISTLFFRLFGIEHWRIMAVLWAIIPIINAVYFSKVPIYSITQSKAPTPIKSLIKNKLFWLFIVFMICAGASEQAMSQWASAFAESGLGVSKTTGDLLGPCAFAVLMGTARVFYAAISKKLPLPVALGASAALCAVCYAVSSLSPWPLLSLLACAVCGFSVGILWPGTFSLAAKEIPTGGTRLFALLALFGDFGCAAGPFVVGQVTSLCGDSLQKGLLVGTLFPLVLVLAMLVQRKQSAVSSQRSGRPAGD